MNFTLAAAVRNITAAICPVASFRLKYKWPLEWGLKLLISPTTSTRGGSLAVSAANLRQQARR